MISIELNTKPIPWAAARVTSRGAYNPKDKQKSLTRLLIRSKYQGSPIPGYVVLEFAFYFPLPNSIPVSKRSKYLENIQILPTQCDCTNLQKFYEDCIKNILITDDRNVAKISSQKLYAENEKIIIRVWTLEEYKNEAGNR